MNMFVKHSAIIGLLIAATLASFTAATAQNVLDPDGKYLGVVERNQAGEIVISTGPDTKYFSSQVSETKHQLFCQSNTAMIIVTRRVEDSDQDTLRVFDFSATLNGEKIDIFQGEGRSTDFDDFTTIDVQTTCIEDDFKIFLMGYSASRTRSGSTLLTLRINATTGQIH
ncbi:hypothetical protein GCM10011309_19310 [Litorimonas cladophorae]|uniref:Uncharacterized protein n=1 Tax=Litorimonas cladophorae TaxID=1220491 RepID=A0A918KQF6_9PROT|nr:hypothetical protein [Litorimonas cladophorae]GGX69443.1 hypothetical protein GCM10011309_19310 [Litorimonas cladophorae]